jgi:hypothetical protein
VYPTMAENSQKGTRGPPFAQFLRSGVYMVPVVYLISHKVYSRQAEYYPHT